MGSSKRIKTMVVVRPGVARATFASGEVREIEWGKFAHEGPVFARLADPDYSDKFKLGEHGWFVVWPDGMDWDAGAVYKDSKPVGAVAQSWDMASPAKAKYKPLFGTMRNSAPVASGQTAPAGRVAGRMPAGVRAKQSASVTAKSTQRHK
jgi:hypothetical protein